MSKLPTFLLATLIPTALYAADSLITIPEKPIIPAQPERNAPQLPDIPTPSPPPAHSTNHPTQDFATLEAQLNQAINQQQHEQIPALLAQYQTHPQADPNLVLFAQAQIARHQKHYPQAIRLLRQILANNPNLTPVRVELAVLLFREQQNTAAQQQFQAAQADPELPADIHALNEQYLNALGQRKGWHSYISAQYLNESNVNNVSSNPRIENTPFIKNPAMQPQKAHGIGYAAGSERDINLKNAHYAHISGYLYGKTYWDNHAYDDITARVQAGYAHKSSQGSLKITPFYEQQWYATHRYKHAHGIRAEKNQRLTDTLQLTLAAEISKQQYRHDTELNGNSKTLSTTLYWQINPRNYIYSGIDALWESTRQKTYSYHLNSYRIGWEHEWNKGLSSRISLSTSSRRYQANYQLGRAIRFDRKRQDEIYTANLTIWKRDWHIKGITPKLSYQWRKQHSNFDSLFSYHKSSLNLLLEKTF
ncbi:surface lipoprotein assembly modifier [Kingella sp. (in: b-proteobacteria)]|uniref:surface lipoprotein assembly modifier n=1 Tax=Kingella sp. (in: b-proteobacteria) TaxID=2020713 RepID=UPI0026DB47E0|nr:surface lipoprotein assembly modifier [Kingella sp. (in: b-proteobacteria)]MDO4657943.1 surface lipoprotein assembly modifier [Kingella sp. (in: b-proteobacteria)]